MTMCQPAKKSIAERLVYSVVAFLVILEFPLDKQSIPRSSHQLDAAATGRHAPGEAVVLALQPAQPPLPISIIGTKGLQLA